MSSTSRSSPFFLNCYRDDVSHCIFAKIERGVSRERSDKEIRRLNSVYQSIISHKKELDACLQHMITTESYRLLSKWTYELFPKPLRGRPDFPELTEVIFLKCFFPILNKIFILNLYNLGRRGGGS